MKLAILGPPGAGKGTQASRLSDEFSIPRIATGDMLRMEVNSGTDLGHQAQQYMQKGVLVPDDIIIEMIRKRLSQGDVRDGFILDGFPRSVVQAEALEGMGGIDGVVYLDVSEEEVVQRFLGRRACSQCQAVYHLRTSPPRVRGMCDRCGASIRHRADDREEVVRQRFRTYREKTEPLVRRYGARSLLMEVDGSGTIQEVYDSIKTALASRGFT